ncbi:hypothetical protein BHM03_00009280, partial [Ensete ventricosum]
LVSSCSYLCSYCISLIDEWILKLVLFFCNFTLTWCLKLLFCLIPFVICLQDLQYFPRVRVKLKLHTGDDNASKSAVLNIRLEKANPKHSTVRAFAPRYPKVKDEAWWLVLGNATTSELYALKRVSFSGQMVARMELPPMVTNLQVRIRLLALNIVCVKLILHLPFPT